MYPKIAFTRIISAKPKNNNNSHDGCNFCKIVIHVERGEK